MFTWSHGRRKEENMSPRIPPMSQLTGWRTSCIFWAWTMSGRNPGSLQVLHWEHVVLLSWLLQLLEAIGRGHLHSRDWWNQQTQLSRYNSVQYGSHRSSLSDLHPVSPLQRAKHVTQEPVMVQGTCASLSVEEGDRSPLGGEHHHHSHQCSLFECCR